MFDALQPRDFRIGGLVIHGRVGGSGSPLLLLHGHPQTHVMWHRVADTLARRFIAHRLALDHPARVRRVRTASSGAASTCPRCGATRRAR